MSSTEKSTALAEAHAKASLPMAVLGDPVLVVTVPISAAPDALELARTLLT